MTINIHSTRDVAFSGVKLLVYGAAGVGKTSLIATAPAPIILSAEAGLLALSRHDLPVITVDTIEALREAHDWLASDDAEATKYETVCLDSISEIAEVVLSVEKREAKDPLQAYGAMQEQVAEIIRAFRDLPRKHVYFTAKLEKSQDEMGRILYSPSMPGNKLGQNLPYFFDEVLALRVEKGQDGALVRALQTQTDGVWMAKDRSGVLDAWEDPNLQTIIDKITRTVAQQEEVVTPPAPQPVADAVAPSGGNGKNGGKASAARAAATRNRR